MYESGTWESDWKAEPLTFREVDNPMTKIESLVEAGDIQGQEVFLFTDNSTFESTYYQGYSTSWKISGNYPMALSSNSRWSADSLCHTRGRNLYENMGGR